MFHIGCTRFNNSTYEENIEYRKHNGETVIYGTSLKIRNIYTPDSLMFIAEMNNEKNRVEGIGLIRNKLVHDKRHKIYEKSEYNRYIYRGNYWLSREQLNILDPEILEILDTVLFKGKSHLKCRTGISILSEKLFVHWIYELRILKNKIKTAFLQQCNNCVELDN
jgi:TFIIF-interacting CTD phosphatase-like protein